MTSETEANSNLISHILGGASHLLKTAIGNRANVDQQDDQSRTPLMLAADQSNEEMIDLLIAAGADTNLTDSTGKTALMYAASKGLIVSAKLLINSDADPKAIDQKGKNSLIYASEHGHDELAKELVRLGADINAKDNEGRTALDYALSNAHIKVAKVLLSLKPDINQVNEKSNKTILQTAVDHGSIEVLDMLLESGVNINSVNQNHQTALMQAAAQKNLTFVKALVERKADLLIQDIDGNNALLYTISQTSQESESGAQKELETGSRYEDIIHSLLQSGVDLEQKNLKGQTALLAAVSKGQSKIVELLLNEGAEIQVSDAENHSVLGLACENADEKIMRLLLEAGAQPTQEELKHPLIAKILSEGPSIQANISKDLSEIDNASVTDNNSTPISIPNIPEIKNMNLDLGESSNITARNAYGQTALMVACDRGIEQLVDYLLKHGAQVNIKDFKGMTSLMIASFKGYSQIVNKLISYKAQVNVKNSRGYTALTFAILSTHLDVVKQLVAAGANINNRVKGVSHLMMAASTGSLAIVQFLLENGADLTLKDYNGNTASVYALSKGHEDLAKLLTQNESNAMGDLDKGKFDKKASNYSIKLEGN